MTEHASKAHILAAATAVFAQKGFAKASMNDIVRASGLSKGGVYWHFNSKDDIITTIFNQFFIGQLALMDEVLASTNTTATGKLKQLARQTGEAVADLTTQFPSPLEFYALAARDDRLLDHLRQHLLAYQVRLAALITGGILAGEFKEVNAEDTAAVIIGQFEGVLLLWSVQGQGHADLTDRLHTALDVLLAGLTNE